MARFISELADFFKDVGYNLKIVFRKLSNKYAPWDKISFMPPWKRK
jgi:hypothetical protein